MLIHSFSQTSDWFQDYADFAAHSGASVVKNNLVSVGSRSGISLSLRWVTGDVKYLSM